MSEHKGRVIVITGGETGIGRAAVLRLAGQGAILVIGGILEEEGAATVKAVRDAGGRAEFHRTDVRKTDQVDALVDGAVRDHGRIDGLICSAADTPEGLYIEGAGAYEFERTASRLREMQAADWGAAAG